MWSNACRGAARSLSALAAALTCRDWPDEWVNMISARGFFSCCPSAVAARCTFVVKGQSHGSQRFLAGIRFPRDREARGRARRFALAAAHAPRGVLVRRLLRRDRASGDLPDAPGDRLRAGRRRAAAGLTTLLDATQPSGAERTVLVVDDSRFVRTTLRHIINNA